MDKVEPYDCWEGVMNGCLEDKDLDNILSILDSPMEGLEGDGFTEEWDASKSQCLGPLPPNMLADTGLPVLLPMSAKFKDAHEEEVVVFHTQSPVSVLQGNNGLSSIVKSCPSKRTRSKRARRSGPSPWLSMLPPFAPAKKTCKAKGRRKKPSPDPASEEGKSPNHKEPLHNEVKKCVHCEVTKTPQWREGPTGPKTLCNACGVRYRSGRLCPEYRPVASPTFVPSIHSNSHRKVIEMRNKGK